MDIKHSRRSCTVHQLPEYADSGYPPSYEYPLPVDLAPSDLVPLHPWIQQIAALSPGEAHEALRARWKKLRNDALCRLRDYILECEPLSVVITGSESWVLCVHKNGGLNLVAPPLDESLVDKNRLQWHMDDDLLTDVLANYGGLREDFAPGGGHFIVEEKWEGVTDSWMEAVKGQSKWKNSLIIFSSRGGDKLLVHRTGKIGWWIAGEVQMREAYPSIEAALADFVSYRRAPWPFDPYPPRLNFPRLVRE
jgi:hypothetical protein